MTTDTLREAVARAQSAAGGFDPDEIMPNGGPRWRYYLPSTDAALSAIEAAGWRIVPAEPTGAMIDALEATDGSCDSCHGTVFSGWSGYRAMLSAAPRLDATVRSGEEG